MLIAKIVSSNSHVDYVARVVDEYDAENAPTSEDYGFGDFVTVNFPDGDLVGVIYNSLLLNPEYAAFGPRLSSKPELDTFSPDYLNEQGVLIGILLLGRLIDGSIPDQKVPARVIPPGEPVCRLGEDKFRAFHTAGEGSLTLGYYPQVMSHAGAFAVPLLDSIITRLTGLADETEARRLEVLRKNLSWQRTFGSARL